MPSLQTAVEENNDDGSIYQKFDAHAKAMNNDEKLYSLQFIKKYLLYAKTTSEPILTDEVSFIPTSGANIGQAIAEIIEEFGELRVKTDRLKTLPVTPRMLETMIRLSTAHAKASLSEHVTADDVRVRNFRISSRVFWTLLCIL